MDENNTQHLIFGDGSSLGNPGRGGWGTVLVIGGTRVVELGGHEAHTTNNRMELAAIIFGLKRLQADSGDVTIYSDSTYVRKGATEWAPGWARRGWKTMQNTDVENQDLWRTLLELILRRKAVGHITWTHVPGHSGVAGNERCDQIATSYASQTPSPLFDGSLADYAIDILNIDALEEQVASRSASKSRSKAKAYSYLSLVGGVAKRHLTWAECEARVKGKSGVKYKKALSPSDESAILASWGARLQ
jgi:ribonuclease HI